LIAFDEAANLYTDGIDSGTGSGKELPHTSIRQMLRGLRSHPLWTMFMSTNARIEIVPSQERDGSARIVEGTFQREQPFSSFVMDIECNARIRQSPEKELNKEISQFATVDHMTMFGRPLWRLYAEQPYKKLHDFVYMKMLGGNTQFSAYNVYHTFTAVASRVCIDLSLDAEKSLQFTRETIDNHLRLLIGVDQESGMLKTATPSEPVVAEVAATLLVCNDGTMSDMETWTTCIQTLSEKPLGSGIVDKGTKGELFGRLLCILARDQLPDGLSTDEDFRYSRPFKVEMFLNELLGYGTVNGLINGEIQRRRHGGVTQDTLPVWDVKFDFREGWCNFNHFTFTTKNLPRDRKKLQNIIRQLLRRNAALQLAPGQSDWDLLLPVYTGDINKPIERDHLSAIFVQIMNRQKPEKLTLGTEYRDCYRPDQLGFCLQMEFGASWQKPSTQMRWPRCKRLRGNSVHVTGRFVFGMQVFGTDDKTFPFLAKYPDLGEACGNLMRTLTTKSEYPDELPVLQAILGFDWEEPSGGTSRGAMGGHGGDDDGEGVEDDDGDDTEDGGGEGMHDDGDDIDGRIGEDLLMSGME
jgi:hypothetical protein